MNTKIKYMYRDADINKISIEADGECCAFNDGDDCICYAAESRCNYCKKAVDD